jgi:hypothetical protein
LSDLIEAAKGRCRFCHAPTNDDLVVIAGQTQDAATRKSEGFR